jgi:hypothetical protein
MQPVQFEYETKPKPRSVRLIGPAVRVGDPVRVGVSGVEVEGRIVEIAASVLHVEIGEKPEGRLF